MYRKSFQLQKVGRLPNFHVRTFTLCININIHHEAFTESFKGNNNNDWVAVGFSEIFATILHDASKGDAKLLKAKL